MEIFGRWLVDDWVYNVALNDGGRFYNCSNMTPDSALLDMFVTWSSLPHYLSWVCLYIIYFIKIVLYYKHPNLIENKEKYKRKINPKRSYKIL